MSITAKRKRRFPAPSRSLYRPLTRLPLRWALTVPFVLLTVGATTLVGYLSHQNGEQTVANLAAQLMQEKGDQTVLYLERSLEVPHLINQLNADSIRLGKLPGFETTNLEPLEKFFWVQLLRFPDVTSIAMGNNRGGMVGSGRRLVPEPNTMNVYRTAQFARGLYTLSITNPEGKIIETKTISENYDARTRPWYETPAKAGEATWSPIYQYISDLQMLGISAGLPVYTDSGTLRGILTADINLKRLSDFLSRLNLSPSGQVFIVERSGLLVASSTNQSIARRQAGEAERINAGESENPAMRETMAQLNARFDNLTRISATQQFTIQQSQSAKWVRVIPFQDRYGLDWLIVMVVPETDFMGAIHANQATALLLCLLTLGGAIGLGILAANQLTRRFAQLNRISRELAAGNLDRRLLTNGSIAELNGLAHTFNQMADQLQNSFDRIKTALAESKEKFTTIFRTSPEAVAIASLAEGRFLEVNDSFLHFFGYLQDEVVGKTALDLRIWSDLAHRDQYRTLLEQQGSVRNLEAQVRTRSGEIKTVLLSAEVRTLEGQDCILVMHRDITERKAVELALQHSEARYRAIVEDQTELISRSLPDSTLTFVNDAYCRYFKVRREDVVGKSYHQFIHQLDQEEVAQRIHRLSATHPTVTSENRVVVNGEVRWVQWSNRLLFDEHGNIAEVQTVGRDITELKQTEEALRKSEVSLRQAQQIARLGSWEFDPATQNLAWSEEMFRIAGLDPAQTEPSRTELLAMLPEEDCDRLNAAVQQLIASGISYEVEHRIVRPDGSIRYVVSKGQVAYRDRQIIKLQGTALDITDRKLTENALQEREAMLRAIGDNLPKGFIYQCSYEPGKGSRYSYISAGVERLLGLKPEDVLRDSSVLRTIGFEEDLAMARQVIQEAIKNQKPFEIQMRNRAITGKIQWSSIRETPRQLEDGRVVWDGVEIDITELKQIEAALRESEERFRRAFDDAPIGVSLVSPTGRFVKVNRSYCNLMGYSPEELFALTFQDITHPEDLAADFQGFQQMLKGETGAFQMQKRYVTKQGTIVPVLLNAAPIRDEAGEVLYVVGHVQDIRDRLAVERIKDEFISVVSHELRTPLTSIRGALGILGSGVFHERPQQAAQMLKIALNNSDRLVRLINDILTLERLQSGKAPLMMESCQVSGLMQQAIDSVQALADQSGVFLSATPISATVFAAPDAIVQTLTNLLSNAIKFSAPGGVVWLKAKVGNEQWAVGSGQWAVGSGEQGTGNRE
jgi:PAS domain S-box-containing protein